MTTGGTTSDNEWQWATSSDKEWQRVVQRVTTNFNEWPFRLIFLFFQIRGELTTKHPKENSLNLKEDLWRRPIELRAETSSQKEILTVRSGNCRSSCLQIFTKIKFIKILQYSQENICVESLFRKVAGLEARKSIKKETPAQVFSCKYCEIFKNSFFYGTSLVAASGIEPFF